MQGKILISVFFLFFLVGLISFAYAPANVNVTFSTSGLTSDYTGVVLTVDGASYTLGNLPRTFSWPIGTAHPFSFTNPCPVSSGKRYLYSSMGGTILQSSYYGTVLATIDGSIICNYNMQYYLTVYSAYDTPAPSSGWFTGGGLIMAQVKYPTVNGYTCVGWTGTGSVPASGTGYIFAFDLDEPSSITWIWKSWNDVNQWTMQMNYIKTWHNAERWSTVGIGSPKIWRNAESWTIIDSYTYFHNAESWSLVANSTGADNWTDAETWNMSLYAPSWHNTETWNCTRLNGWFNTEVWTLNTFMWNNAETWTINASTEAHWQVFDQWNVSTPNFHNTETWSFYANKIHDVETWILESEPWNTVEIWQLNPPEIPPEPVPEPVLPVPIIFIFGMVGLACMIVGPCYGINKITKKEYRDGLVWATLITAVGFALFLAWIYGGNF